MTAWLDVHLDPPVTCPLVNYINWIVIDDWNLYFVANKNYLLTYLLLFKKFRVWLQLWVWCQQAIWSMPSVQQQKTLVLKRPVLFAEQINPVSLPSVVLHGQGCRRQKLPVHSNTISCSTVDGMVHQNTEFEIYMGWLCGVVLWWFLREPEVKQRWARLVHGWVTVHDRSRFVAQWGVLMQPKNRYRMTPGVRHSGIVNWLIYFIYSLWNWQPMQFVQSRWHVVTWFQVNLICRHQRPFLKPITLKQEGVSYP